MKNYNKTVRSIIKKWIEEGAFFGMDEQTAIYSHLSTIYDTLDESSEDEPENIMIKYLLIIAYLDAYKMCSYYQKECTNSDLNEDTFGILNDIEDYYDLQDSVYDDPKLLANILLESQKFNSMSYLGKSMIIKSLTEVENNFLMSFSKVHKYDLDSYNNLITIDTLINFIIEREKYQNEIIGIDFKAAIVANILGYIRNLVKLDYNNAIYLVLEIGKIDYATSKYYSKKDNLEEIDVFIEHSTFYENHSTYEIIEELTWNQDFLKDALWNFASTCVFNEYNEEEISNILESKEANIIAKKLVLK